MSKIAVVSMYDDNYSRMAEITIHRNFRNYCDIHGYDLIPFKIEKEFLEGRHPQWGKIKLLKNILGTEKYDWLFFLDCDCLIMNPCITLDSFIDPRFDLILPFGGGAPDNWIKNDPNENCLMSSQMIVKYSEDSLKFLEEVWGAPDWPAGIDINEFDHEMRQLRISFNKPEWFGKIKVVPEKYLNRFWPVKNPHVVDTFPNILKNLWEPGDFIAHVISYNTDERVEILSLLSEFVGGFLAKWQIQETKVFFKPLKNLDYIRIDGFFDGSVFFSWEFYDIKREIMYWFSSDFISCEKELTFVATDRMKNIISTFKFTKL